MTLLHANVRAVLHNAPIRINWEYGFIRGYPLFLPIAVWGQTIFVLLKNMAKSYHSKQESKRSRANLSRLL